jgi:hypothetical protein
MTVPMKVEIDCATGVITERPLNDAELTQLEIDRQNAEAVEAQRIADEAAKTAAKEAAEAKLVALGLTTTEIAAL